MLDEVIMVTFGVLVLAVPYLIYRVFKLRSDLQWVMACDRRLAYRQAQVLVELGLWTDQDTETLPWLGHEWGQIGILTPGFEHPKLGDRGSFSDRLGALDMRLKRLEDRTEGTRH